MVGKIYINGLIGTILDHEGNIQQQGVELIDVITQVKAQPSATSFDVYINSLGGVVDTGYEIRDYLNSLEQPYNTIGLNLVASIATIIFMGGVQRTLKPNTEFFIHLPSGGVEGTSDDVELYSNELKRVERMILDDYVKTTGLTKEALLPLLREETTLDIDQAFKLGFSNVQPIKVAPVAYFNLNKDKQMANLSNEDKSWIEKRFEAIENFFTKKPVNIVVQDANGVEIDFPGVEEGQEITVGSEATIDGSSAEGEYVMPDGSTYVFAEGSLSEIIPAASQEEEMKAEIERLTAENNQLKEEKESLVVENNSMKEQNENIQTEFTNFKSEITSKFELDGKKNKKEEVDTSKSRKLFKD